MSAATALLICGALGPEVKAIADRRHWDVEVHGLSAYLHLYPARIVSEVDRRLQELSERHQRVVVVYGDCGTAGRLDPVLERHGAVRVAGPHCYEMFAGGAAFERLAEERPATYFLTDWLVRNFDRAVVRGLGLDRHPDLKEIYFGNYEQVLYLRQAPLARLLERAREIASYLGLPLEVTEAGLGELETRLAALVEDAEVVA